MKATPPLPMLVLLPGLDGTGKLFAAFVRALGAGVESRVIGYSPDEPLGYEELEPQVRAALPRDRPYVLLGESFSGPIAMRIAASVRAPRPRGPERHDPVVDCALARCRSR